MFKKLAKMAVVKKGWDVFKSYRAGKKARRSEAQNHKRADRDTDLYG